MLGGGSAPSLCVSPFAISWQEVAVGWELELGNCSFTSCGVPKSWGAEKTGEKEGLPSLRRSASSPVLPQSLESHSTALKSS